MFIISINYRTGHSQQLACESIDQARRGWQAISDAMEKKLTVVIIENPDCATTIAVAEIASCGYGMAAAPAIAVVDRAASTWAN